MDQGSPVTHDSSSNAGGRGARLVVENCIGAPALVRRVAERSAVVVPMSVWSGVDVESVGWGVVLIREGSDGTV